MSKILQKGEFGFGIIKDNDGYISQDLNKSLITEGLEKLKEGEPIYIDCILQKWGVKNKNGRIYPKEVLVPQVEEYGKLVQMSASGGEGNHPDCVQLSNSQILTRNGWKWFKDIKEDEEILTLNIDTNQIEIQKIEKKILLPYEGKMYKFLSTNLELTVTPNHRFLLENKKGKRFFETAEDIFNNINKYSKHKILKLGDWIGKYDEYFIFNGVNKNKLSKQLRHDLIEKYTKSIEIKSEDWFAFMGIYLSEGHCGGTKSNQYKLKGYDVVITQKNEEKKKVIVKLLNKLPFEYTVCKHEDGKCQYHIHDARLYDYLFPLGHSHTKYIPVELKQASPDLLKILFDWFQLGDGRNVDHKRDDGKIQNHQSVFSTSKRLIEDLHEILVKIGGSGNITTYQPKDRVFHENKAIKRELILSDGSCEYVDENINIDRLVKTENSQIQYNLNISKAKHIYLDKRFISIKEIDFNDEIACVRVPNGNFMVKVNGKSHWTGNSSVVSLGNIAHLIRKMWWGKQANDQNILYGKLELIVSPGFLRYGVCSMIGDQIAVYLFIYKMLLGISSRGVGSLKEIKGESLVQNDFELISFDLVTSPSTPGAYLFPEKDLSSIGEAENKFGLIIPDSKLNVINEHNSKIYNALNKFLL